MKTPKAKPSEAEKAVAEVGIKTYNITSPMVSRIQEQIKALSSNPEAVVKRLQAKKQADIFQQTAKLSGPRTTATFDRDIARGSGLDSDLMAGLAVESTAQAKVASDKALQSQAALGTGLQVGQLSRAGREGSALTGLAIKKAGAKSALQAQTIGVAGEGIGMITGQIAKNVRNEDTNWYGGKA
jgi:hypothetical protein